MKGDFLKNIFQNPSREKIWFAISPKNTIINYEGNPYRPLSYGSVNKKAIEVLKIMSSREDIGIFLQSQNDYYDSLNSIRMYLRNNGIDVTINKNTQGDSYSDVIISEKNGFDQHTDWDIIKSQIEIYRIDEQLLLDFKEDNIYNRIDKLSNDFYQIQSSEIKSIELELNFKFKLTEAKNILSVLYRNGTLTKTDIVRIFNRNKFLWSRLSEYH